MRVNLVVAGNPRHNYLNIGPWSCTLPGVNPGDVGNLDNHVEDAEASEIIAEDVIDFVDPSQIPDVLSHWVRKLARGGTLTVGGLDLREVGRRMTTYETELPEAIALIYGGGRKSALALRSVADHLASLGLEITYKGLKVHHYIVTGRRP